MTDSFFNCPRCGNHVPQLCKECAGDDSHELAALEVRIVELEAMLNATLPYFAKMQADGIQTVITPATVAKKIEALLEKDETHAK